MKTKWVIGVVAAAHCVAIGSVMLMSGCGTTGKTAPEGNLPPPSEVKPAPMPPSAAGETNVIFKPINLEPVAPAKTWNAKTSSYTVAKGDTLSGLAKRFKVSKAELMAINKLKSEKIKIGQKLTIPGDVDVKAAAPAKKTTKTAKSSKRPAKVKPAAVAAAPAAPAAVESMVEAPAPAAEEATPVMTPQTFRTHIVDQGEDLVSIGKMWEVSVDEIKKVNGLIDDNVKLGQKLKIPVQ